MSICDANNVMEFIESELIRASERNYIIDISSSSHKIKVTFNQNLKKYTVNIVLQHMNMKYGELVHIHRDEKDDRTVFIWNKIFEN